MAKGQLRAEVESFTQSKKVVVRDSNTGALVRQGRARQQDGTEDDPIDWSKVLNPAISEVGDVKATDAISIVGQEQSWKYFEHLRENSKMVMIVNTK
jgi:xylulokinase